MHDCIAGRRGQSRWHPRHELGRGWRPPSGALAIYHRGNPGAFTGHVDRVISTSNKGYQAVGANEGGRKWDVDFTRFSTQALLGFVVDGEPRNETAVLGADIPPDNFVEPLLTHEERLFIRGFV